MRMSPQLHNTLYGFHNSGWGELAFGGYRPKVFMTCGLEVGLWMTATATTGFWLWASGSVTHFKGYPLGWLALALIVVAVLCKVTGAVILLILGLSFWFILKWTRSRLPAIGLILLPLLYMTTRTVGLWSGDHAVTLIRTVVNEARAHSLQFRITNEDMMIQHALKAPWFGWGGYGRNLILTGSGRALAVVDGMWMIALGLHGVVGLIAFESILLLPMALLLRRYPVRAWRTPTLAPTAVLVILANLYSIDCLANAMANPIYFLVIGGVTGTLGMTVRAKTSSQTEPDGTELSELLDHLHGSTSSSTPRDGTGHLIAADRDPRESAAIRFGALGRSLIEHGMTREADEAWSSAIRVWAELAADYPDDLEYRRCRLDCLNDVAWTLITRPGFDDRDIARAIPLAEQTVSLEPESATYWNTLGIAYFRAHDWKAAIHALGRSTELDGGGTSFDFFFLAMAWWHQGDREQANHWYLRGNAWMEEQNPDHEVLARFREEATALLDSRPISV
jgi:tetratricopeptide (TPR) repeat protein